MEILFLNSKVKNCGVYQYGLRLFDIVKNTQNYIYYEIDSLNEYNNIITDSTKIIIYNYHASTMPWLNSNTIQKNVKNISISHECNFSFFDMNLDINPDGINPLPRPIFEDVDEILSNYVSSTETIKDFINYSEKDIPIFGSFGFGFQNKGFHKIILNINEQYHNAIIKFVIPDAFFDPYKQYTVNNMVSICKNISIKKGIKIMFIHEFFTTNDLLYFLRSNTMNIFMYDEMYGRGISSVIDYALSVKKPLGISNSYMFRHIYSDKICLYKESIEDCMNNSVNYCSQFLDKYSHKNVIETFKKIIKNQTYSQSYQDQFVLKMTNYKYNGRFLEIGSNHPFNCNNTYLLRHLYDWKGIMVEYDKSFESLYKNDSKKPLYIIDDARNINYKKILDTYRFPECIDYLQIDLDVDNRSTLDTLELLDNTVFDKYTFATVTFEHDIYRGNYFDTREKSRKIFKNRGYILIFPDVSTFYEGRDCQFEDWYIHPSLVPNYISYHKSLKCGEIFDILPTLKQNISVEVSIGELVDKYSILELKIKKIKDSLKIIEINKELESLKGTKFYIKKYEFFYNILLYINEKIWDMTDDIKKMIVSDSEYSIISNQIFEYNQKRFRLKNFFNILFDSNIKEQKSYSMKCCKIYIENEEIFLQKIPELYYLSIEYDQLYIKTNIEYKIKNIFKSPNITFIKNEYTSTINLKDYKIDCPIFIDKPIKYIAGGKMGDFIQSLSVINEFFYKTGRKGCLYLSNKGDVFNFGLEKSYKDVYDLIISQPYISSFHIYNESTDIDIDIDLTIWRYSPLLYNKNWINIYSNTYNIEWGKHKWLLLPNIDEYENTILISTSSYRFPVFINFKTIHERYTEKIVFISQDIQSYNYFIEKTGLDIPFIQPKSFIEMCTIINSCKLFIGSLSSQLAISFACHKPNVVGFFDIPDDNHNKHMIYSQKM
jgi:hypothetical protein